MDNVYELIEIQTLRSNNDKVGCIAWNPAAGVGGVPAMIASCCADKVVMIWHRTPPPDLSYASKSWSRGILRPCNNVWDTAGEAFQLADVFEDFKIGRGLKIKRNAHLHNMKAVMVHYIILLGCHWCRLRFYFHVTLEELLFPRETYYQLVKLHGPQLSHIQGQHPQVYKESGHLRKWGDHKPPICSCSSSSCLNNLAYEGCPSLESAVATYIARLLPWIVLQKDA